MQGKIKYEFTGTTWQHSPTGGWHFVALPGEMATEIRQSLRWQEEGWGRLKAKAQIGASEWDTAIWFDTKQDTYLLPLKAVIRKKENISADQEITVTIWL